MNVVYALWLRQLKRFSRSKVRIVGVLGQPLIFLTAFGFGMGPIYQRAGQGNYLQFLAPGIMGMTVMFASFISGVELIFDRQFGFLKATLVSPVPRRQIMLGRTLGGATVAMIQGTLVIIICTLFGFRPASFGSLVLGMVIMTMISIMFTALGTALASVVNEFQVFHLFMNFLIMPMFFLSGALFPLRGAGGPLRFIARVDPFAYGVDGLRAAMVGGYSQFGLSFDVALLGFLVLFFVALGGRLFARIQI
jgi:ABC-2 type transport system permease protein